MNRLVEMQTRHLTGYMMWLKYELRNEDTKGCMFTHRKAFLDQHPILGINYISGKTGTNFRKLRQQ